MTNTSSAAAGFRRTRITMLAYTGQAIFGFAISSLGPAMPLLRSDLSLSRTIAGLHLSAVATMAILCGLTVDRLTNRLGRWTLFWLGGTSIGIGGLTIALGTSAPITISGAALIGAGATALLNALRASLADIHGANRAVALAESDAAWAAAGLLPGLLIGALSSLGFTWRLVFPIPAVAWLVLFLATRREEFPQPPPVATENVRRSGHTSLPRQYWMYWMALVPSGAGEWCLTVWSAGFLVDEAHIAEGAASFVMTGYFAAMGIGRLIGSRLARRFNPARVLNAAFVVGATGVLAFWLAGLLVIRVLGLFVAGLGVSLLFPLIVALAVGTASDRPDAAIARVSIAAGASMLVAPLTLGWIADQAGIYSAWVLVPSLFVAAAGLAGAAQRMSR